MKHTLFTPAEAKSIEAAVTRTEAKTSAEIVPIVAQQSGQYQRGEDLFGLLVGVMAVVAFALLVPTEPRDGSWDQTLQAPLGLGITLIILLGGLIIGVVLARLVPAFAKLFTLRAEEHAAVQRRASDCFVNFRVSSTARRDGLLIYVSLRERLAWVVADDAIMAKVPHGALKPIAEHVTKGFRSGTPAEALVKAIDAAGDILASAMPAQAGQSSELSNQVRQVP